MIKLSRILVPTDFSENGRCALPYAAAMAEQFHSELYLLHVLQNVAANVPTGPAGIFASAADFVVEWRRDVENALKKLAGSEALAGKRVTTEIRDGQPFLEIIRFAREQEIDLIVIGTHGRSGLAQVLMGSVAERVVRKAGCPVLTVRPAGHQFVLP